MTRPCHVALTVVCLLAAFPTSGMGKAVDRPNILFIMVDDLGKDWIGCYGADGIKTPHIDALARSGMKFHNAWSMPQCTPTRVTLLTGQYPWRTGWVNHWDVPRWGVGYFDWQHHTTFARRLRSAGYTTAIAGKWQINDFRVEPDALHKHGFDDWCVWTGYEATNPPSSKRYWDPYIHTKEGSKTWHGRFGPDIYCDFLIDFMKKNVARPMMLYFPMALTHGPLVPTPAEPDVRSNLDKHQAMVRYTDQLVGRLVRALNQLEIRRRTIIVFTTDNGTSRGVLGTIGGHRPRGGKGTKYESGVCAPFIVNGPGLVPEGVETDALTDFTDLLPTFAELGGVTLPSDLVVDGRSLAPLILGKAEDTSRTWIMALGHGPARVDSLGVRGNLDYTDRVIRDKRYKVWVDANRQITQLYDLKRDPWEQTNLIDRTEPDVIAARTKFRAVVDSMPVTDARPQYRKRQSLPWDRAPDTVEDQSRGRVKKREQRESQTESQTRTNAEKTAAVPSVLIEVQAGKYDRDQTPIVVDLPEPLHGQTHFTLVRLDDQTPIDVQALPGGDPSHRIVWILDKPLSAGQSRRYRLTRSAPPGEEDGQGGVQCRDDGRGVVVSVDSRPVLRYNHAIIESPAGIAPLYRRSGYIHPMFSPSGRPVTGDFAPDHPHQHGVFFAWVNTTFDGRHIDFWNQAAQTGRVEHLGFPSAPISGHVFAQLVADLQHSDVTDPDHPVAVLHETWTVRVYHLSDYFLVDLHSSQRCVADKPLQVHEYHYGGMAMRGASQWFDPATEAETNRFLKSNGAVAQPQELANLHPPRDYLTSEGKTWIDGNATRARWVEMHGKIDGAPTGVTVMGHPENFRAPQPVRLHPTKPYFCFAPMLLGSFRIEPGQTYCSRYRFYVHDGPVSATESNRLWGDYSHPPIARVVTP